MPQFDIRFMKTIADTTGHDRLVCQWRGRLDVRSESEAVERAKAAFCRDRQIDSWTTHADAIELQLCRTFDDKA